MAETISSLNHPFDADNRAFTFSIIKTSFVISKSNIFKTAAPHIIGTDSKINLTDALESGETICSTAPIYVMKTDKYGDLSLLFE